MARFLSDGVKLYEADLDQIIAFLVGDRVLDGCGVTAQASPNMSVRVASGTIAYSGAIVTVAAVDPLSIANNGTGNPRIDLIEVDGTSGVATVKQGTAAATPKPPTLTAGRLLLAYVSVVAGALNIQTSNISERRIIGSDAIAVGTLAARPAASAMTRGTYFATDSNGGTLFRSNGSSWVQLARGITEAAAAHAASHALAGTDELTALKRFTKTHSASGVLDILATDGHVQEITLGANATSVTLTGFTAGVTVRAIVKQDATGGRTVGAFPASADFGDAGTPTMPSAANKGMILDIYFNGTKHAIGYANGFTLA